MYLDRILGSTTKINALSVLISNPKRGFMEIELAKKSELETNLRFGGSVD